jgi:hypothetical protein
MRARYKNPVNLQLPNSTAAGLAFLFQAVLGAT